MSSPKLFLKPGCLGYAISGSFGAGFFLQGTQTHTYMQAETCMFFCTHELFTPCTVCKHAQKLNTYTHVCAVFGGFVLTSSMFRLPGNFRGFVFLVACKFCGIETKADEGNIFGVYECVVRTHKFGFVYKDAHVLIVKREQYKIQMYCLSNNE